MRKIKKELIIKSSTEMIKLGQAIGSLLRPNMLIALDGDLGTGKTTLTKGIALGLGISDIVNSPTFTIMKIYQGQLTLYHLDVYRLDENFCDFELEEYFEADGVCVIEWSKQISKLLPSSFLQIELFDLGDEIRKVILSSFSEQYNSIIEDLNL